MTEPTVRLGTQEDMHEVMALMKLATEENAFIEPSMEKIAIATWGCLTRQNGLAGIATADGVGIHGFIMITVGENIYSDKKFLEERVVFVHPEWRSMRYALGKKLVNFGKRASDELGLPLLIGILSNRKTAAKVRMYRREFGEPAGAFFLYGSETGLP